MSLWLFVEFILLDDCRSKWHERYSIYLLDERKRKRRLNNTNQYDQRGQRERENEKKKRIFIVFFSSFDSVPVDRRERWWVISKRMNMIPHAERVEKSTIDFIK